MNTHGLDAVFRPINEWPGEVTRYRQRSRFKARWSDTLELLTRELKHVAKPRERPVVELALTESDIRLDGYPRANARPEHPGVIISIESRYGPLRYPCDRFDNWQDNIRAIALALEALRKVDRYGVTKRGEQYTGWKALPPAGGSTTTMTAEAAAHVVARTAGLNNEWFDRILADRADFNWSYRLAARYAHPDGGGTVEAFQRLQAAKSVLDAHHESGQEIRRV